MQQMEKSSGEFFSESAFKVLTIASVSGEDEETAGHRQIQFDGGETLAEQLLALSVVCGYFE
ncbi:MAG: hypothetical protein DRQ02_05135 [Candidatus Latescibacterota bacterium]|nr:MAG: hypothetical protein DRQ02_05135 [Candidatus Latescibacterota bacterium]RKY70526.1 MAG: hypothetical protein DRQ24_09095 [Candidatus Latescibacterota bacterium]